ncbi:MAG TPA: hypothetical protein VGG29_03450 [Caulobacteraceae bacterium]
MSETLIYPAEMTQALKDVLGMHPGDSIMVVGAMRAAGFEIASRYEDENAALRHYLIPFALQHGDDWRSHAGADLVARAAAHRAAGEDAG